MLRRSSGSSWQSSFLDDAFSAVEQSAILVTTIRDSAEEKVSVWEPIRGNDCEDQIFLLSASEAENYFSSNEDRISQPTEYAKEKGLETKEISGTINSSWLLRTFSSYEEKNYMDHSTRVDTDGGLIWTEGGGNGTFGIRPAMWVKKEAVTSFP